jgi:hypothetical protein
MRIPGLMATAALATAAAISVTTASAETAEEAVGYAFLGLAENATLTRGATSLLWHQTSSSPAVFEGHGEGGGKSYDVSFTVTRTGDCDFVIDLAGPGNMVPGGKALYAKVSLKEITAIKPGPLQVTIEGKGFCETAQMNPNCVPVPATDLFGSLDPEKHLRLVTQLQKEVCVKPQ